jgi:predicted permease
MALWNDFRFALRQFRATPGFVAIVLATLGLAIGANAAVYSVLNAVLFRSVPYPAPDRLAVLAATYSLNGHTDEEVQTGRQFLLVRDAAPGLDVAAFSREGGANFAAGGRPEYIQQQRVSSGFFRVLGVAPQFGREFSRAEDVPGGPALAVLSHAFWQRIFRGDLHAIGRSIMLRGEPYTVIGVMPRDFRPAAPVDVWTPLRPSVEGEGEGANYGAIARLKPGVSFAEAEGQLKAISRVIQEARYLDGPSGARFEERLLPYQRGMTGEAIREDGGIRTELLLTWGAVLVVLLIGCVNIAGLLLARSRSRSREIATRMAVGGSRARIVRQLLVESLVLSLAGCLIGIAIGSYAIDGLKRLGAATFELWHPIALDWRVMLVMLGIGILTALLFGLAPAIATSRIDIRSVLVEGGRGMAGGRRHWSPSALVVGEVALSLVLLVSAGLLLRTLAYFRGLNPGFDPRNVIAAEISLQDHRYQTNQAVNRLFQLSLEGIRRIPGVRAAAAALTLPYERPLNSGFRTVDGNDREGHMAEWVYVTPGYFAAMRIPILRGREFRESDTRAAAPVLVVSRSFAERYFPSGDALGRHLACRGKGSACEIVGIAADVAQHSGLTDADGPVSIEPTIYYPAAQNADSSLPLLHTWFSPKIVIRTAGPVRGLEPRIEAAVAAADPLLPVARFHTTDELRGHYTAGERYLALLISVLAGLAVLLAAIGLYGLIGRGIVERKHEIGVRLALGASAEQTVLDIMKPGLVLGLAGVLLGAVVSLAAVRLLRTVLWGVQPGDPSTFALTAIVLLSVTAVASLVPALRILRVDPAQTLRSE